MNITITATHKKTLINQKIPLFLTKHILNASVITLTRQYAHNTCETFPLKCWLPSNHGHLWPTDIKCSIITNTVALIGIKSQFYLLMTMSIINSVCSPTVHARIIRLQITSVTYQFMTTEENVLSYIMCPVIQP
jgi:hypothetical protein